ncbi:Putative uncharacterized protein [Taphrina deformans PYCC 5710]|uniref:Pyridoxamine 5'-phosphate oxidase N-terminal domain-containing protein n=1 Tax=Taphrina deformans (strain PYCC 5710 / ATCC 11124 / CBS 356.35 / IMI 108563 / JCM 9778 / NBRC 8474) TaxID=1097556 RepID=R4XJC7_TAPDE|nr:Putative uncharacterized protein [Taphrina deformans PYCC 5710]|eukprot:CCG83460.1 Putative uncharacterized protein [Taphrina deformans PYCC 5710]
MRFRAILHIDIIPQKSSSGNVQILLSFCPILPNSVTPGLENVDSCITVSRLKNSMENTLPQDIVDCLKNARYLHLGTCAENYPHVSLMNYIYVPAGEGAEHTSKVNEDCVVMLCSRRTKKFFNITINPKVSLLVHDWSTRQQATNATDLTALLSSLNAASLSKHSITLNGNAEVLDGPAETFFKQMMLDSASGQEARCYVEDPESAVILVHFGSARISDNSNNVEKWKSNGAEATPLSRRELNGSV